MAYTFEHLMIKALQEHATEVYHRQQREGRLFNAANNRNNDPDNWDFPQESAYDAYLRENDPYEIEQRQRRMGVLK